MESMPLVRAPLLTNSQLTPLVTPVLMNSAVWPAARRMAGLPLMFSPAYAAMTSCWAALFLILYIRPLKWPAPATAAGSVKPTVAVPW